MVGDGAVIRGQAYGMRSIRVDGNDALAVYSAVHAAREMAISECRPILVEVLSLSKIWLEFMKTCQFLILENSLGLKYFCIL